jgi:hypothetical protein
MQMFQRVIQLIGTDEELEFLELISNTLLSQRLLDQSRFMNYQTFRSEWIQSVHFILRIRFRDSDVHF